MLKYLLNGTKTEVLYLVVPPVKPGTWDIESLLRTDGPVASQILAVDKHYTFAPALRTQPVMVRHDNRQVQPIKCRCVNADDYQQNMTLSSYYLNLLLNTSWAVGNDSS